MQTMQTQLSRTTLTTPLGQGEMVICGTGAVRHRKSVGEILADLRITDPLWMARFDDANLSVVGSADIRDVLELIVTAPGGPEGRLAGFVEGLWVNN